VALDLGGIALAVPGAHDVADRELERHAPGPRLDGQRQAGAPGAGRPAVRAQAQPPAKGTTWPQKKSASAEAR
jgi:hypothetical protein